MIRILALSDIHNNLTCVDKLVTQVADEHFDCAVVAGDIGNQTAPKFFEKLAILPYPIFYIYGNWDSKLGYDYKFSANSVHLHGRVQHVGDYHLGGFSGCPAHWGDNPIYQEKLSAIERLYNPLLQQQKTLKAQLKKSGDDPRDSLQRLENSPEFRDYLLAKKALRQDVTHENKQALVKRVLEADLDVRKTIIVTHERLSKLNDYFPAPPLLNMFGHIHQYSHSKWQDTTFINVSHLDNDLSKFPRSRADAGTISASNYCIVTIDNGVVLSEKKALFHS